jgi:decaprenylphospho-beta-D-erythro-pentofuranosid-2-ulose 2-reductase
MAQIVWIFGATSAIAEAWARLRAHAGDRLTLVGRDRVRLDEIAADLRARGASGVEVIVADFARPAALPSLVARLLEEQGAPDVALAAQGVLPDPSLSEQDFATVEAALAVNFASVVAILNALAPAIAARGHGVLTALGSVAGDRGKRSNYIYGATKSALAVFLDGLRGRLEPCGCHVVTVKLGYVDSPMTAKLRKGPLWSTPARIARSLDHAIKIKRRIVYLPWFWRPLMAVIRMIPEPLFVRLGL